MVDVRMPYKVLLSVPIVVGGWGFPIFVNIVRIGTAVLTLWKIPIVLASTEE